MVALALGLASACGDTSGGGGAAPTNGGTAGTDSTSACTPTTIEPAPTSSVPDSTPEPTPSTTQAPPPSTAAPTTAAPPGSTTRPATSTTRPPTTAPPTTAAPAPAVAVYRGPSTRAVVALTFDAGSDCGFAAQILDTLAAEGIHATFGMTGQWAEANPALVRRMVNEGHLLLNHTYDHQSFTGFSTGKPALTAAQRRSELERGDAAVQAITGRSMKPWFRPPYGDIDASVNADLGAAGYRWNVLWTVDSLGWNGLSAADIEARCLSRAAAGAIYLFHVGAASQDAAALPAIIAGLRARGYGFVTVADLV